MSRATLLTFGVALLGALLNQAEATLVTHITLDEGSGQTAVDGPGSNDLTLGSSSSADNRDPVWITGKFGNALDFTNTPSGQEDIAAQWDPTGLPSGSASRTMSMWVRLDTRENGKEFGGYGQGGTNGYNFALGTDYSGSGTTLTFYAWGTPDFRTTISTPAAGDWHNYVVRYNGSTVYVTLDGTATQSAARTLNTQLNASSLGRGARITRRARKDMWMATWTTSPCGTAS